MATKNYFPVPFFMALFILASPLFVSAQTAQDYRLSILGGLGVSNARGDYPSDYDPASQFSFYPGLRFRADNTFKKNTFMLFDVGYMEKGFKGYVGPTDSYFYNTYEYININALFGSSYNTIYYAAGLYLGMALDAYSYREYTDENVVLDSNGDFGIVGEAGVELAEFLSLGVQVQYGLKSIGTNVDIKNWAVLGTIGIHFLRF